MSYLFDDTICAPASASGGAISVIRVSGSRAIEVTDSIFHAVSGKALSDAAGHSIHFGNIVSEEGPIDEVLVSVFRAPHSYTGENSIEISCHGSSFIVQEILSLLIASGARMATPGEFTQRAFIHGKMDLSQAEAVADLIASQTAAAHRVALNQLKGRFSNELSGMRNELLHIVSLMELELDFSEEEVEFADRTELRKLIDKVIEHISVLISSFKLGNAIKNGVPVAIVGSTNAGKSTLLNAIVGQDRAIVSDIAGTTRDTIEESYNIGGTLFRFIDTAGLRKSSDVIEQIGIERSYASLAQASLVIAMIDLTSEDENIYSSYSDITSKVSEEQKLVVLLNKADIVVPDRIDTILEMLSSNGYKGPAFAISARNKQGLQAFLDYLESSYSKLDSLSEGTLVTNLRHLDALKNAHTSLLRVRSALDTSLPTDLISQDIREAIFHLGSIVGEISTDEVLGNIFKNFCVGK